MLKASPQIFLRNQTARFSHLISKKQICGEAFSKVSVDSTRGQQRKDPVEKHESGTMLMSPVTFFGRRVNAVQNEEPQNQADCTFLSASQKYL